MRICMLMAAVTLAACSTPGAKNTVMAPKAQPTPGSQEAHSDAEAAREDASKDGTEEDALLIAVIGTTGEPDDLAAIFGDESALGDTPLSDAFAGSSGVAVGSGGLGLRGTGVGGGGAGIGGLGGGTGGYRGPQGPRGRVQLGTTATKNLAEPLVRKTLLRHTNQFRYCYDKSLRKDPKAGGVMEVELTVDKDGRTEVTRAEVKGGIDTVMLECVRRGLARTRFPKPDHGQAATVKQTLTFDVR